MGWNTHYGSQQEDQKQETVGSHRNNRLNAPGAGPFYQERDLAL
jgi:hypothetical protein